MKRAIIIFTASAVAVLFSAPAFASLKPVDKLTDGVHKVVMSPMNIKNDVMVETKDKHMLALPLAATGGLLKGAFYMGKDIVHGAYDIVTFPITK